VDGWNVASTIGELVGFVLLGRPPRAGLVPAAEENLRRIDQEGWSGAAPRKPSMAAW
jgi:hypothetical protein